MPPELMGLGTLPLESTACRALDFRTHGSITGKAIPKVLPPDLLI